MFRQALLLVSLSLCSHAIRLLPGTVNNIFGGSNPFTQISSQLGGEFTDVLREIFDKVEQIPVIGDGVSDILGIMEVMTEGAFTSHGTSDQFAHDLQICMEKYANIFNPLQAINNVIQMKDYDILDELDLPDVEEIAFQVLSQTLYPMKSSVEFVCGDGYELVKDFFDFFTTVTLQGRRRMRTRWNNDTVAGEPNPCLNMSETSLCEASDITHAIDTDDTTSFYSAIVSTLGYLDKYGGSDIEIIMKLHIIHMAMESIGGLIDSVCNAVQECAGAELGKSCGPATVCITAEIWHTGVRIVDLVIEFADEHDDLLTFTRVQALFQDRIAIIHNQFVLKKIIEDQFETLWDNMKAIDINVDAHWSGDAAKVESGMAIDGAPNDVHDGTMTIKINTEDVYTVILVVIGFLILFIVMAVALILKCCNEQNGYNVVKYESESGKE